MFILSGWLTNWLSFSHSLWRRANSRKVSFRNPSPFPTYNINSIVNPVCLSASVWSVCLSVSLVCPSVSLVCLSVCLSVCQSGLSVCKSGLSVCLSVCLSDSLVVSIPYLSNVIFRWSWVMPTPTMSNKHLGVSLDDLEWIYNKYLSFPFSMLLEHQNKTQLQIFPLLSDPILSSNQNKRNREEESSLLFLVWKTHGWDSSLNLRFNHGEL